MPRQPDAGLVDGRARDAGETGGPSVASDSGAPGRAPELVDAGATVATDAAAGGARASLVDHALWQTVAPEDDPFDDMPAEGRCQRGGIMAELLADEPVFSVDTGVCSYLTVVQTTQREVTVGQTIKVRLWHFALSAPTPAEAHATVLVDGLRVLDERVSIPAQGGLLSRSFRVERAIPSGAPVHFHLHNHGENSWSLVEISAGD